MCGKVSVLQRLLDNGTIIFEDAGLNALFWIANTESFRLMHVLMNAILLRLYQMGAVVHCQSRNLSAMLRCFVGNGHASLVWDGPEKSRMTFAVYCLLI